MDLISQNKWILLVKNSIDILLCFIYYAINRLKKLCIKTYRAVGQLGVGMIVKMIPESGYPFPLRQYSAKPFCNNGTMCIGKALSGRDKVH